MRKKGIILGLATVLMGAGQVEAEWVNLCGDGTRAAVYTCPAECDQGEGVCRAENEGAVRWICTGKRYQCVEEGESEWGREARLGAPGCNRTVQLSVFDRKCRREDGGWDETCRILGYMVWYTGECGGQTSQTSQTNQTMPTATGVPTLMTSPTTVLRPTGGLSPTPTEVEEVPEAPETGVGVWLEGAGLVMLAFLGWKGIKLAVKMWG